MVSKNWTYFFLSGFSFTNIHESQDFRGRGGGISLTPHYHFQPLHRHLDISRAVTAESSPLHIASSQTRTGDLWFPSECKSLNTKLPITKNGVLPITTLFFLKILFQFKNLS